MLHRRFVDAQHRFDRQLCGQFFVGRREGNRRLMLQLDDPARRAGLIQHLFQEQRHAALALLEAAHQQGRQSDQPRPGLPLRHTGRQLATGGDTTLGAVQPVQLIFGDDRLDLGNLPDLMPQRLWVAAPERFATAAALLGFKDHDFMAVRGRNQGSLMFRMARLTAGFLAALVAPRRGLGVRMLGTRRQRRIAWRLLRCRQFGLGCRQLGLQLGDPPFEIVDHRSENCPQFRRQSGNLGMRNRQFRGRHAHSLSDAHPR